MAGGAVPGYRGTQTAPVAVPVGRRPKTRGAPAAPQAQAMAG